MSINEYERKTVVVLGPMRSGTSMTAGVLSKLGVEMVRNPVESSRANPLGYFEDTRVHNLNTEIIEAAGGNRHSPPPHKSIMEVGMSFKEEINSTLARRKGGIVGFKDPAFSITIGSAIDFIENPYIVVCDRDTNEAAKSYRRMVGKSIKKCSKLIRTYKERIRYFRKENKDIPIIHIKHRDFLREPKKNTRRLNDFLGVTDENEIIEYASSHVKKKGYMRILQLKELVVKGIKRPSDIPKYIKKQLSLILNQYL